jgi:hypothetical protein
MVALISIELGITIGIAIVLIWLIVIPSVIRLRAYEEARGGREVVAGSEVACVACGQLFGTQEAVAEHISRDHSS